MRCLFSGTTAFSALLLAAPAAIAQPPEEFLDVDAEPVLTWSVPGRYATSWDAYHEVRATRRSDHRFGGGGVRWQEKKR
jgi:hypothetical protein